MVPLCLSILYPPLALFDEPRTKSLFVDQMMTSWHITICANICLRHSPRHQNMYIGVFAVIMHILKVYMVKIAGGLDAGPPHPRVFFKHFTSLPSMGIFGTKHIQIFWFSCLESKKKIIYLPIIRYINLKGAHHNVNLKYNTFVYLFLQTKPIWLFIYYIIFARILCEKSSLKQKPLLISIKSCKILNFSQTQMSYRSRTCTM